MIYLNVDALKQLKTDLARFYTSAAPATRCRQVRVRGGVPVLSTTTAPPFITQRTFLMAT